MSLSRDQVVARILKGDHLIIYNHHVLNIPRFWLDAHPGGSLGLLHFVGRDATSEIDAYHPQETLKHVIKYSIGTISSDNPWEPLLPPIAAGWVRKDGKWLNKAATFNPDSSQVLLVSKSSAALQNSAPTQDTITPPPSTLSLEVQHQHATAYKRLHKRVTDAGLYNTPYLTGYGPEFVRYVGLGLISAYAFRNNWVITSAVFLGLMWHQLMFFAHDLGHTGVTHNWTIDRLIAITVADFIGGLSIGWWVNNHNVHHLVTNHPSHDPDIEHLPFFAISPRFFSNLYSSYYNRILPFDAAARLFISLQHKLFYIVMLFARFNLYANSYVYLYQKAFDTRRSRGGRWAWALELAGVAFFWYWFGWIVLRGCGSWQKALAYVLVSHAVTSPLHVQIVLSHFPMSTMDLGPTESFPDRQMRTTTDVICSEAVEFIHGGLHLQVTHHLFPRLPRHNLRKASEMVKEFAKEEGLVYAEFGFITGNAEVLGVLREVAEQVKLVATVASHEAKEAVNKKLAQAAQRDDVFKGNGIVEFR
ncbi:delta 8-sphingolipid desaturase [Moniliophthora roreri MCA 2997]|uniref:Delta 8-(E)-sphingolipid desaturase n=2 Tax=Moniliophthora roreri TaxID=221103 RepID=V2XFC4_MONRO|nr:delta 8-sphingolipid desaturase [Moniliophthora roreri MCA 2997]KAI3622422.1 delta 8-sphingolipid desaturase [Moniliophthora roreri]